MTTTTDYFNECNTLDDAKNLFRVLVFKLHPDTSGYDSQKDFVQMYKDFKAFKPAGKFYKESDDDFVHDEFYNIVKRFEGLKNVLVTFVGSFIWLEDERGHEGTTKAQKDDIKNILLDGYNKPRFASKRLKWFYSPEGYKQKFSSKKSFEEIKNTWGSKMYKPTEREQSKQLAY